MGISPSRRAKSRNRPAGRPRRTPRLHFDRLEDRLALAASPALSINDVILVEGNAGTIAATFTVSLSQSSNKPISVNYATSDGTASAGSDYDSAVGTLKFAKGQTSKTITVPVRGDTLDEAAESFFVTLSAPTQRTTISKGRGVGTIGDDDPTPALAINDLTISEGDSGTASALFDVTLSAPSGQVVTVAYGTDNGMATAGSDYTPTAGTLTFAPGQTSLTLAVPILADTLDELNEPFLVRLSAPTNAVIADALGVGTIVDDDPAPALAISDATSPEGHTGAGFASFAVTLSAPSGLPVVFSYNMLNGTARAGSDYTPVAGTLTFAPGQTSLTLAVPILNDALDELDETFFVNLSNPRNAELSDAQGMGTIGDDDPTPALAINDVTVSEAESGIATASFDVTLSAPSSLPVTVLVSPTDGTATGGLDYGAPARTITFAPGQTTQTILFPIGHDLLDEDDETFFVNLSEPTNATIADAQGVGTIVDNDPVPSIQILGDRIFAEAQGSGTPMIFAVRLSAPSGRAVTVHYSTADGTATAGSDYIATSGTLTFAPGQTQLTVAVPYSNDQIDEDDETFFLNLTDPTNTVITDAQAVATISDDDPPPYLTISNVSTTEGNAGTQGLTFTVRLTAPSGRPITVSYTTTTTAEITNPATPDTDFTTISGTLTFLPGTTTQTITVPIVGDTLYEPNEAFLVQLSEPVNALLSGLDRGLGTIVNDDPASPPPALSISDATVTEGDTGSTSALFTVSLSSPSTQIVTVYFDTFNATATAGSDYTATNGSLTFLPGETTQTISVPIPGDLADDADVTFYLGLRSPLNATIADDQGIGTILDNDPAPSLSISDVTVYEGDANAGFATFAVTLSAPSHQYIGFSYTTDNGTATSESDYTSRSGSLTFFPGKTLQLISVPILDDTLVEPDEFFFLHLFNPSHVTIPDSEGVATIVDDDPVPTLSISDATAIEGNDGTVNAVFTVTLSAVCDRDVTVSFSTFDGSATSGSDYGRVYDRLIFAPGQTTLTISVPILGDTTDELDESFFLRLRAPFNATIADDEGVGTIIDNDPTANLAFTVEDARITEADSGERALVFRVLLSGPSDTIQWAVFRTADAPTPGVGFATALEDYTPLLSDYGITFLAGVTERTISIPILGDTLAESDELFYLNLIRASQPIADDQAIGIITNDD